jgi:plasmid replication initiation protein
MNPMAKKSYELSGYESEMIKPNELIEIKGSGPLTLQDRRVFNVLLNNAWGKSIVNAGQEFTISTSELKEVDQTNQRLKRSLRRLMTTVIVAVKGNGDDVETQLLGSRRITASGTITYSFPNELAEVLKDSSVFAKLDLEVMRSFSSKYAFALYEAIARRINLKHKFNESLDIEDMRDLLGVEAGKLLAYRNLRIKAIEPAVTEVNAITPYEVTITPLTKGRKVIGFQMYWHVKDEQGLIASYQELQSAKVGRSKRQEDTAETVVED